MAYQTAGFLPNLSSGQLLKVKDGAGNIIVASATALQFIGGVTVSDLGNGTALIDISGSAPISAQVVTVNNVYTDLLSVEIPDLHSGQIYATIDGRRDSGTDRASFIRVAQVYRQGGPAQVSSKVHTLMTDKTFGSYNVRFVSSGNNIIVQVRGESAHTVNWIGTITYQVVGQP